MKQRIGLILVFTYLFIHSLSFFSLLSFCLCPPVCNSHCRPDSNSPSSLCFSVFFFCNLLSYFPPLSEHLDMLTGCWFGGWISLRLLVENKIREKVSTGQLDPKTGQNWWEICALYVSEQSETFRPRESCKQHHVSFFCHNKMGLGVKAICPVSDIHIKRTLQEIRMTPPPFRLGKKDETKSKKRNKSSSSRDLVKEGGKTEAVTTWKLKNLHSCLVLTSRGTAACGAVVLSWPARSTWPAPLAIGRATVHQETRHREEDIKRRKN